MKTVIIFDELQAELQFFVLEGDFRHLNGTYINSCGPEGTTKKQANEMEKKQAKLSSLIYKEDGTFNADPLKDFPTAAVRDGAEVIVAGFLP